MDRYMLKNRYLFTGTLEMKTALHIGGGQGTLSGSDSPVVLTPELVPFIPGSSFKGSLRSTIEKLVPTISTSLFSCALIQLSAKEIAEARKQGQPVCSTVRQEEIRNEIRENQNRRDDILSDARKGLCHTCQLFGSPFAAARLAINDLYMPEESRNTIVQRRDGVAIDRDSEKARNRLKYDFEVVPASARFSLSITLENASLHDLQLISVGLNEFLYGFVPLGGKRSRGLGACKLTNLQVSELVLDPETIDEKTRNERLKNYLLKKTFSRTYEDGGTFLDGWIASLFENA